MAMRDTEFYEDENGVNLRCKLCAGHIGGIELDDPADSLEVLVDMFDLHVCGEEEI